MSSGDYVRLRSPENILEEIKDLAQAYPDIREFYLEVETFGVDIPWALDLCSKLEAFNKSLPSPLGFGTNLRITPNADLENIFRMMERCNFKFINIGLESGSDKVRAGILKRHYSNEDIVKAVRLARAHGIKVIFQILIGIPGETPADFEETIQITRRCRPNSYILSIFFPYPGTELYEVVRRNGLIKGGLDTRNERMRPALNLPGFKKKEIMSNYIWFEYNIYKGYKPLYEIMDRVITAQLKSMPATSFILDMLLENGYIRSLKNRIKSIIHKKAAKF